MSGLRSNRWLRAINRLVRASVVLALAVAIVAPNLPADWRGEWVSTFAGYTRHVSLVQSWKMYAPNPQRAQSYMNLTAHYPDGTEGDLEETIQERNGWNTHFAWNKTRVDIWRHYANFHPKRSSEHRKWYLRAVCVREARRGRMPDKIVMEVVTRRFASPKHVLKGFPGLGRPRRMLVTVQYCKVKSVRTILDADPVLATMSSSS